MTDFAHLTEQIDALAPDRPEEMIRISRRRLDELRPVPAQEPWIHAARRTPAQPRGAGVQTLERIHEDLDAMGPERATVTPERLQHLQDCERLLQLFAEGLLDAEGLKRAIDMHFPASAAL